MTMRRPVAIIVTILALGTIFHQGNAQTRRISNVAIAFSATVANPEDVNAIIAARMKAFLPTAKSTGVNIIHLQSDAYSLVPQDGKFMISGNLFIDVVPEEKTVSFVDTLSASGTSATIEYFQYCRPR